MLEGEPKGIPIHNKTKLIRTINDIVHNASEKEIPVIFVRDVDGADGAGAGFEIHEDIVLSNDCDILDKAATNAFYGTNLLQRLQSLKIEHLVIMGC